MNVRVLREQMRDHACWLAACVLLAIAYVISTPRVWQCEGVDEIDYLSLAHSLTLGKGYTIYGEPHVLYPPLFAAWLSVIMRVAGVTAWRLMYGANALFGLSGLILAGTWLRKTFGAVGRWAAWFSLLAYYPWSFSCRFLMSEPLFLPISYGLLILVWRVLQRNDARIWEYIAIGALSLLAGMTRAAAVSLNLALAVAGLIRWWTTRKLVGAAVCALALGFGVGFFAYWSVRADIVNPRAPESHWRWAKKYLGISRETEGIIAEGEEVTEISSVFHRRAAFAAERMGQFVTSVVRPPGGFRPVGWAVSALLVLGWARHLRRVIWSPFAWYTAIFFSMILKTTWLSNYLRFYVVMTPLVFWFVAEGLEIIWRRIGAGDAGARRWVIGIVAVALVGFVVAWRGGPLDAGATGLYQSFMRWGLVLGWICVGALGTLKIAKWPFLAGADGRRGCERGLAVLLAVASLHAGGLAAFRTRESWRNATLKYRRLDGALACAQWIRETGGSGKHIASLPQVPSFLSGYVFQKPSYDKKGRVDWTGVERVLLVGMLREVPFFKPAEERRLAATVLEAVKAGWLKPECHAGNAVLYRIVGPAPP